MKMAKYGYYYYKYQCIIHLSCSYKVSDSQRERQVFKHITNLHMTLRLLLWLQEPCELKEMYSTVLALD